MIAFSRATKGERESGSVIERERSGQVRSGQVRSGQVRSGQVRRVQVKSNQDKTGLISEKEIAACSQ